MIGDFSSRPVFYTGHLNLPLSTNVRSLFSSSYSINTHSSLFFWSCLFGNLKNFDFLHCESLRAREEVFESAVTLVHAVTTPVSAISVSVTESVLVAVIQHNNVIAAKTWSLSEVAVDCLALLVRLQREFPRRNAVRIPQREEETPQAIISLPTTVPHARFPFQGREAAEHIPVCVQNERQCVRAAVTAAVECSRGETIAAASPQQQPLLHAELVKQWRIFPNYQ
jgi:hypothetical protein